jgi:short-chain fatty acids transporter
VAQREGGAVLPFGASPTDAGVRANHWHQRKLFFSGLVYTLSLCYFTATSAALTLKRIKMLQRITNGSVKLVERYLPDPYVLVLLLTLVAFAAGVIFQGQSPLQMVTYWGDGCWNLLTFAMQMVLVLVTGFVLADTPFFKRVLQALARLVHSPGRAVVLVTVVSMAASWVNWGFGLVIGALFARQVVRTVPTVNYPLLIASAYSGFLVWHGGLAGSIPLVIATEGHFMSETIGVVPTSETIFAPFNLLLVLAMFIVVPSVNRLMLGKEDRSVDAHLFDEERKQSAAATERPAERLENSVLLAQAVGVIGLIFAAYYFLVRSGTLNLNIVNFLFLFLGIIFHGRPSRFIASAAEAVKGTTGIIIQFPFYAGIMAMMVESGMGNSLSIWFVEISNAVTFPLFAFMSAGVVNFMVPSGGGQWAVQAPVMLEAGASLGVDPARTAMAVAWGDAWTNMIQPFWALPALAIAGLSAKDVMGYCLVVLVASGIVLGLGLTFLP